MQFLGNHKTAAGCMSSAYGIRRRARREGSAGRRRDKQVYVLHWTPRGGNHPSMCCSGSYRGRACGSTTPTATNGRQGSASGTRATASNPPSGLRRMYSKHFSPEKNTVLGPGLWPGNSTCERRLCACAEQSAEEYDPDDVEDDNGLPNPEPPLSIA